MFNFYIQLFKYSFNLQINTKDLFKNEKIYFGYVISNSNKIWDSLIISNSLLNKHFIFNLTANYKTRIWQTNGPLIRIQ